MIKVTEEDKKRYDNAFEEKKIYLYSFLQVVCFTFSMISSGGIIACYFVEYLIGILVSVIFLVAFIGVGDHMETKRGYLLMKLAEDGELLGVN